MYFSLVFRGLTPRMGGHITLHQKVVTARPEAAMPLFGSAKKVVPVDGTAAGSDAAAQQPAAEDSVTFDTFKATVDGSRLGKDDFWSKEARVKLGFQLLDVNNNGRLTRDELQQGISQVRDLFAELEEPPEAVVAGVVAVGSRVHKSTYEQPMKAWAEKADALLPKQVQGIDHLHPAVYLGTSPHTTKSCCDESGRIRFVGEWVRAAPRAAPSAPTKRSTCAPR